MWIRTLYPLQAGTETIPANTKLEVDDPIGRLLVRRGKAETITVLESRQARQPVAELAEAAVPDQGPQKSAEK